VFDDIPPDSSTDVVEQIARLFREHDCDSLIAVGGGSVMDTAKATNILVSEGGEFLRAYVGAHKLTRALKPLVAIATTAGTGSEVTSVAVIKDTHKQKKDAFQSSHLMPAVAVIDPRMTMTVPPGITAATAMDALTHSVEAFTCLAKNPLSDAYASAAIRKIVPALPLVLVEPSNTDARLDLAEAATMAGIAFSNSMVGLVHAIGHSLGAVCHLHHGTCMSVLLPYVLEYNVDTIRDDLGELLPFLAGDEAARATPIEDRAEASIAAIRELRDRVFDATQLPRSLSESGKVDKSQFEKIADLSVDDGALMFNPVEADRSDILTILENAWSLPDQ
jgi:alcohol dehydrogenase